MIVRPHSLFFLGIGGIGMSALARYYRRQGARVAGYDRTSSALTDQLKDEGIDVQFDESPDSIPGDLRTNKDVLVVRTPAVPLTSPLQLHWQALGARIVKRSELLGAITRDHRTVAIAGTHGKTTVSTMLAHLLHEGGMPLNAFLGGISANYGSNVLLDKDARANVVEADEYDRSFLQLRPNEAIITAMDPDHLDIYGTPEAMYAAYAEFAAMCTGRVLVNERVLDRFRTVGAIAYGFGPEATSRASNVTVEGGAYRFDLTTDQVRLDNVRLGMPGRHNVENAVAAASMAIHLGVGPEHVRASLASFRGVERRFQVVMPGPGVVLIDDYAHHPAELAATIGSVRELYPDRKITGIFQPHLFSRTHDLAAGFAQSLAQLDELVLLDIYPARETPIPGITAEWLLEQVPLQAKVHCPQSGLMRVLEQLDLDVVLMLGAGDIDRLVPHVASFIHKHERS
ncbi:MAG: UDP-N-acetylmuramate--L-alanine ligase [Flavobacteriales bacterium]|nr:UDP-N-acetylmuramate--L-alanine ligase [Flavobacteriales bacterium]MCB9193009.1 UDP-N-acetylmuramate--L-alanine ligase [Flavobacteriales bacterium]